MIQIEERLATSFDSLASSAIECTNLSQEVARESKFGHTLAQCFSVTWRWQAMSNFF